MKRRSLTAWGVPILVGIGAILILATTMVVVATTKAGHATQPLAGPSAATQPVHGPSAQEQAVRAAVEVALRTHQGLPVPPADVVSRGQVATEADLARQKAAGSALIEQVFGGEFAAKEKFALQNAIDMESTGILKVEGGGINHLNISSVEINATGDQATAKGTVETWSRMSFKNPDGKWVVSEPHNSLDFTMTLTAVDGKWVAMTFDWTFAPGSEP